MDELKQFLLKILDIIEYPEDKEVFVGKFNGAVFYEVYLNLLDKLEGEDIEKLTEDVADKVENPEKIGELLNEHFEQDVIEEEMGKSVERLLTEFISGFEGKLTQEQEQQLSVLINEYK